MGVRIAAADGGHHYSAGRTLYSARQSNLGSERGGETYRDLHTAPGNMACSPIDGEQGLGDIRIYKKRREVFGWKCRDGLAGLRGGWQPQW